MTIHYLLRQSAKIIATIDLEKSAANNSLYVFSLRNNSAETIEFYIFYVAGDSDFVTYYAFNKWIL